jgi:small-conductance mechanosensitive channel
MDDIFNYIIWLLIIICFILIIIISYAIEEVYYNIFGKKIDLDGNLSQVMTNMYQKSTTSEAFLYRWGLIYENEKRQTLLRNIKDYTRRNYAFVKLVIQASVSLGIILYACYFMGSSIQVFLINSSFFSLMFGLFFRFYISNYVHGLVILSSDNIRVDDYIAIGNYKGIIINIGRIYTLLLSFKAEKYFTFIVIPNEYLAGVVEHLTRDDVNIELIKNIFTIKK